MTDTAQPATTQRSTTYRDRGAHRLAGRPVPVTALAALGSVIAVEIVGAVGRAAGAQATALNVAPLAVLTVVGVVAAAVAWLRIGARDTGAALLARLVPIVLVASFVPDLALGLTGTPWAAVAFLMLAHVAVFAVTVPTFVTLLKPTRGV